MEALSCVVSGALFIVLLFHMFSFSFVVCGSRFMILGLARHRIGSLQGQRAHGSNALSCVCQVCCKGGGGFNTLQSRLKILWLTYDIIA